MIKVNNLKFKYNKTNKYVIDDLSFEIKENTITLILGLNGCGKTTLIKLITGLLKPCDGDILVDGRSICDIKQLDRSKLISYVSQFNQSNYEFNVLDYLLFGMTNELKFYENPTEDHIKRCMEMASKFDIEKLLDKKLGEISGGERQLVSICSALLQDSKIIILDEPTSSLDFKNQSMVLRILKNIVKENNKTIIFTSHNPNHALALNANVLLINNGKIEKQGSAKDIVNKSLQDVYGNNLVYSNELDYKEVSLKI